MQHFAVQLVHWLVEHPAPKWNRADAMSKPTLQQTLTLANAVTETPENYRVVRELRKALQDLVAYADGQAAK